MICDTNFGNINQEDMECFTQEHNNRLKDGWLGKVYGLRNWDIPMAFKNAPMIKTDIVLDIGCGESLFFILAAEEAKESWGIDNGDWGNFQDWFNTLDYFEVYREGKAKFHKCNAAILPFPNEMFDKVYTFSSFEHFVGNEDRLAAQEVNRVLKRGGLFCGTVDYNPATEKPLGEDHPCKTYTLESFFRRIVEPSGLGLVGEIKLSSAISQIAKELFFLLKKAE